MEERMKQEAGAGVGEAWSFGWIVWGEIAISKEKEEHSTCEKQAGSSFCDQGRVMTGSPHNDNSNTHPLSPFARSSMTRMGNRKTFWNFESRLVWWMKAKGGSRACFMDAVERFVVPGPPLSLLHRGWLCELGCLLCPMFLSEMLLFLTATGLAPILRLWLLTVVICLVFLVVGVHSLSCPCDAPFSQTYQG